MRVKLTIEPRRDRDLYMMDVEIRSNIFGIKKVSYAVHHDELFGQWEHIFRILKHELEDEFKRMREDDALKALSVDEMHEHITDKLSG